MQKRSPVQMIVSISTILSVIVGSISLLSFVQTAERRLTTIEIRLENLVDSFNRSRSNVLPRSDLKVGYRVAPKI